MICSTNIRHESNLRFRGNNGGSIRWSIVFLLFCTLSIVWELQSPWSYDFHTNKGQKKVLTLARVLEQNNDEEGH